MSERVTNPPNVQQGICVSREPTSSSVTIRIKERMVGCMDGCLGGWLGGLLVDWGLLTG